MPRSPFSWPRPRPPSHRRRLPIRAAVRTRSRRRPRTRRPVLELSLDDAVKRTLENNADIAVERFEPGVEPTTTSASSRATTSRTSSRPRQEVDTRSPPPTPSPAPPDLKTSNWTYNVGAFQSHPHRRHLPARFRQHPPGHELGLLDLQPLLLVQLQPEPDPAPAARLQDRLHALPDQGRQEELRDLRRAVPADGGQHRGQREAVLLRPHLCARQPGRAAQEPRPGPAAPGGEPHQGARRDHGPPRRRVRAVGGGQSRGERHPGGGFGGRRGRHPQAGDVHEQRAGELGHADRSHRPAHRRAGAGRRARGHPDRPPEAHRHPEPRARAWRAPITE